MALITSREERENLAELNLIAGKRAKTSTAYASALKYVSAGAALLDDECWERRHDLIFQLELHRAECQFQTGELALAAECVEMLRSRASDTVELATATCLGIDVYLTLSQVDRAVAICLDYLHRSVSTGRSIQQRNRYEANTNGFGYNSELAKLRRRLTSP